MILAGVNSLLFSRRRFGVARSFATMLVKNSPLIRALPGQMNVRKPARPSTPGNAFKKLDRSILYMSVLVYVRAAGLRNAEVGVGGRGGIDPKGGAVEHGPRFFAQPTCHHAPELYGGIRESEAADMMRRFFLARR